MNTLVGEWRRCAPWLEAALDGTHSLDDVWAGVANGEFHFWPGLNSAAVGELVRHPRRAEQILHAMYLLMSRANLWAEGAAASALAAAWKEREDLRGKKVVLILTGGNVDAAVIRQVLERHA